MKGCPVSKNYDCNAYLGNHRCGLVLDEECNWMLDEINRKMCERLIKKIMNKKTRKKLKCRKS